MKSADLETSNASASDCSATNSSGAAIARCNRLRTARSAMPSTSASSGAMSFEPAVDFEQHLAADRQLTRRSPQRVESNALVTSVTNV